MLSTGAPSQVTPRLASNLSTIGGVPPAPMQPYNPYAMAPPPFSPFAQAIPMGPGSAIGGFAPMNMPSPGSSAGSIAPGSVSPSMYGASPIFNPMGAASPSGGAGGSQYNFSMRSGSISSLGFSQFGHPLSTTGSVYGDRNFASPGPFVGGGGGRGAGARTAAVGMGAIAEDAPAKMEPAPQTRSAAPVRPGPGMNWMIKNNKMIVSGFNAGSAGREKGVKPGDILRKVNEVDVLKMVKSDQTGRHPAVDLLLGPPRSFVTLTFLRVQRARPGESSARIPLVEYTVSLPRVYPPGMEPMQPAGGGGCCVS